MNPIMIGDWLFLGEPKNIPFMISYRFNVKSSEKPEALAEAFKAAAIGLRRKIEHYSECYKVHNMPATMVDDYAYFYEAEGLKLKAFYEKDSVIVGVCVETC